MSIFKFIKEILIKFPKRLLSNILAAVAVSVLGVSSLLMLAPIIDLFLKRTGPKMSPVTVKILTLFHSLGLPVSLTFVMIAFMVMVLITSAVQVFGYWLIYKTKYDVCRDIMFGTFQDFFAARWLFFSSTDQGKIFSSVNRELMVIGDGFVAIGLIFSCAVQCFLLALVPFFISWQVTLLCLLAGGLVSFIFFSLSRYLYSIGLQNTQAHNKFTGMVYEVISSAKLVLGFGNAGRVLARMRQHHDFLVGLSIRAELMGQSLVMAYRPVGVVVVVIALLTSRYFKVPVAEVATLLLALLQVTNLMGQVLAQKNIISRIIPGYEQVQAVRERARKLAQVSGPEKFVVFKKEIALENISFAYPGRHPVLHQISLCIPKGETVAFVGRSGSGKTTLVDILMGLHEPSTGGILVDGISLGQYDIISYRERLGYVPQESVLFNMSIRDNLLWALPGASDADIREACRMAYADEFIDVMPEGYDTVVGDRGVRLSGGQIQRMALARAFLRKPEIFFLDEATSSLDSHSETLIQKAIEAISKSTTVIIVAHRLATVKKADTIYVLDKGRIVESGSYKDLCSQEGYFSDLARFQKLGIQE